MITSSVFNIAKAHADALFNLTGQVVVPVGRSPLSSLIGVSYIANESESPEVSMADVLAAATEDTVDGPSDHTTIIGARIDALTPLVTGHINFIQTVVTPEVEKFDVALQSVVSHYDSQNPTSLFNVIQVNEPAPLLDEDFVDFVKGYMDGNIGIPSNIYSFPATDAATLTEIMRVSSDASNRRIIQWLGELGDDWLLSIWKSYFELHSVMDKPAFSGGFSGVSSLGDFDRLNVSLALFLIARGMYDNPIEGATMPLATWNQVTDQISRFAANQLQASLFGLDGIKKTNSLVTGVSDGGKTVTVFAPTYAEYLEQGGSIEDILGAAVSGRQMTYTLDTLKSDAVDFRAIWQNYFAIGQSTLQIQAQAALRAEAKALFAATVIDISDDEVQAMTAIGQNAQSLIKQANLKIDSLSLTDLSDTRCVALELIAGMRYSHTPAKQFLMDMHSAMEAGCTNAREAAAVAAANYMADVQAHELALSFA